MVKLQNLLWSMLEACKWAIPALIAVISLYAAILFAVWQSSGQRIPDVAVQQITVLFLIAIALSAVLFVAAYAVALRERHESQRRKGAIGRIGDFIGEGVRLKDDALHSPPSRENIENSTINVAIKDWEGRTTNFMEGYEPKLASILLDRSGITGHVYGSPGTGTNLANEIDSRLIRLRELLFLIALR